MERDLSINRLAKDLTVNIMESISVWLNEDLEIKLFLGKKSLLKLTIQFDYLQNILKFFCQQKLGWDKEKTDHIELLNIQIFTNRIMIAYVELFFIFLSIATYVMIHFCILSPIYRWIICTTYFMVHYKKEIQNSCKFCSYYWIIGKTRPKYDTRI